MTAVVFATAAACRHDAPVADRSSERAVSITAVSAVASAADSAYSIPAQLLRFRASVHERPTRLVGGATSLDALVQKFVAALDAGSHARLDSLALNRAEFAYLYYDDSPLSKKPYELDPDLMWMQITDRGVRGLARAMARYANGRVAFRSYACEPAPMHSGAITLYNLCQVTHLVDGAPKTERLFGSIVERDGLFKFVGYANGL